MGVLGEPERILLRQLAVFSGGWSMGAAEAVCAGNDIACTDVPDVLDGLVHKSLVRLEDRDAENRYRLLETVRQYALEKLEAAGEVAAVRGRHLEWCIALGEEAEPHFRGPQQLIWLDRLELERTTICGAALHWSTEHPSRAEALGSDWPAPSHLCGPAGATYTKGDAGWRSC